jgi:hypothetical protein
MKKTTQKLNLKRETIRTLDRNRLPAVGGGALPPTSDGDTSVIATRVQEVPINK